jgi:preprotein translocase subunit SecF
MEFFRIRKDIPFMRHALVFNVISLLTFLLAVFFLFSRGLHLSVEFTGGTLIEINYAQAANLEKVRERPRQGRLQRLLGAEFRLQPGRPDPPAAQGRAEHRQDRRVGDAGPRRRGPGATLRRVEFVGPQVGKELAENGALALLLVSSASSSTSPSASSGASRYRRSSPTCTT